MTRRGTGTLGLRSGDSVYADRDADSRYAELEAMDRDQPTPCAGPKDADSFEVTVARAEDAGAHERILGRVYGNDAAALSQHRAACPTCRKAVVDAAAE